MKNEVILDLSIKGVLISFSIVATVTFKVRKMTAIYSQMIGHLFNTITVVLLYWKRMTVSLYDVEVEKQAVSCYQPTLITEQYWTITNPELLSKRNQL